MVNNDLLMVTITDQRLVAIDWRQVIIVTDWHIVISGLHIH